MATPGQLTFARRLGPAARLAIWVLVGVALVVTDSRVGLMDVLKRGFSGVLAPIERVARAPFDFAAEIGGFLVRHRALQEANARLAQERATLYAEFYAKRDLEQENARLRELLGLARRPGRTAIAASILYQGQDWFARRVTIDRGAASGLVAGLPVVDAQGLVGQLTRVYSTTSEVTLVTHNDQLTPVMVERTSERALAAGGTQADRLELRFVPVHADVVPGDRLLTSGIDGVYPPGLPVARVLRVTRPQGSPYARIECVPLAGLARDRAVLVLRPSP
jgi:rod shape-determining protein MreC